MDVTDTKSKTTRIAIDRKDKKQTLTQTSPYNSSPSEKGGHIFHSWPLMSTMNDQTIWSLVWHRKQAMVCYSLSEMILTLRNKLASVVFSLINCSLTRHMTRRSTVGKKSGGG